MLHGNGRGDMWWPTSDVGKMTEAYHELAKYFHDQEQTAQDSPQQSEGHDSISRCSSGAVSDAAFIAPHAHEMTRPLPHPGMTRPPSHPGTHQHGMFQQYSRNNSVGNNSMMGNNSMGPPLGYAMS